MFGGSAGHSPADSHAGINADGRCRVGPDGPPGGPLTLQNSNVTANTLSGAAAVTFEGGGVYLQDEPITLTHSVISQNVPDQCFGC